MSTESPVTILIEETSSALDAAREYAATHSFPIWSSLLAKTQTAGRGQMRRTWTSPPGNIYAAMRLPLSPPFHSSAAAIALGALCAQALRALDFPCYLKWPNDLVLETKKGHWAKTGGILLEERGGLLLGGIGINVIAYPAHLRDGTALSAASLSDVRSHLPQAVELWDAIVKKILLLYKSAAFFVQNWRPLAESLLIWKNARVCLMEDDQETSGIFLGIGENGAALIANGTTMPPLEKLGGSMKRDFSARDDNGKKDF